MTYLTADRDALAKVIEEHDPTHGPLVDALIASGAVIDATTLADDMPLMNAVAQAMTELDFEAIDLTDVLTFRSMATDALRALAVALAERGQA